MCDELEWCEAPEWHWLRNLEWIKSGYPLYFVERASMRERKVFSKLPVVHYLKGVAHHYCYG